MVYVVPLHHLKYQGGTVLFLGRYDLGDHKVSYLFLFLAVLQLVGVYVFPGVYGISLIRSLKEGCRQAPQGLCSIEFLSQFPVGLHHPFRPVVAVYSFFDNAQVVFGVLPAHLCPAVAFVGHGEEKLKEQLFGGHDFAVPVKLGRHAVTGSIKKVFLGVPEIHFILDVLPFPGAPKHHAYPEHKVCNLIC